jgi:hypothetical protein
MSQATHENKVIAGFAVVRVDRHGELPAAYLRGFDFAGRHGLRRLTFGPRPAAHLFERHADAEEVARRLRRRISAIDHDYVVEEMFDRQMVADGL